MPLNYFDKALAMNEDLYQAHQGKGMVFLDQDEIDMMMESFNTGQGRSPGQR